MNQLMRVAYLAGWAFFVIAIIYRLLEMLKITWMNQLPFSSRGALFFSGFLFVVTIATAVYAKALGTPAK